MGGWLKATEAMPRERKEPGLRPLMDPDGTMTGAERRTGQSGPGKWLGMEDSNLPIRIQSPLSYH